MKDAVILLSGGMDSATLLHHVRAALPNGNLYALSLIYGQKHARELDMARLQAERANVVEHQVLDISFFAQMTGGFSALTQGGHDIPDLEQLNETQRQQPPTYVPNRNMILLSLAAAFSESRQVPDLFYGAQAQDEYGYWDCTADFVTRLNHVLQLNRATPVRVHAPFTSMKKAAVLRRGLELGVDYALTWSCYRGGQKPCQTCPTCIERLNAFSEVGVPDPLLEQ